MTMKERDSQVDVIGSHAAMLSLTEVGLGSLLHSFHIPFSGHFLSFNQFFLLSRASAMIGPRGSRFVPGSISFVAAALKSLSPAGKKLTPMLAIGMQGLLYNVGILLFGHTTLGRIVGAGLSSVWGFLQPLMIYYFIFGQMLFQTLLGLDDYRRAWLSFEMPSIWFFLSLLVAFKIIASVAIAWLAPKASNSWMAKYTHKMTQVSIKRKNMDPIPVGKGRLKKIAWLAAKDMCVWPFVACVCLTASSLYFIEGATSTWLVWNILRPIAVGFLLFFAIRVLPMERLALWLEKRHQGVGQAFRIALLKVRQM